MPTKQTELPDTTLVTVCSACKRASCWLGLIMCHAAVRAGTVDLPVSELRRLNLEHPSYWIPAVPGIDHSDGVGSAW
jgi:hypothetical protein